MLVLPDGLAPEVYPLAWLVGRWQGAGVIDHPATGRRPFVQDVTFTHDGGPYLAYTSTLRVTDVHPADDALAAEVDAAGDTPADASAEVAAAPGAPPGHEPVVWSTESGYWRVVDADGLDLTEGQHAVELLLADPSGYVSVYLGAVGNGRIDLASDLVARTSTGAEVTAATRMYGLVQGDLLWAWDLAAFGHRLRSYASAQLTKVDDDATAQAQA